MNGIAGLGENLKLYVGERIEFLPSGRQLCQENGDIVVAVLAGLAAGTRAIEHNAIEPTAIGGAQRSFDLYEDRIIHDCEYMAFRTSGIPAQEFAQEFGLIFQVIEVMHLST